LVPLLLVPLLLVPLLLVPLEPLVPLLPLVPLVLVPMVLPGGVGADMSLPPHAASAHAAAMAASATFVLMK
ncbi:hypothetical protein, partial [Burkholderia stabilis]|uniref:hypothetical protein n=1 Tax=Burkholderia stabilis TaxID=95485 RepID=UPI00240976D4